MNTSCFTNPFARKIMNMKDKKFLKNTSWLFIGQFLRLGISFIVGVITTRYLGPSNYGVINYIQSYVSFFTTIVGLGFGGILVYELLTHEDDNGKILGTSTLFRFVTGVLSVFIMLGVIYIADGNDQIIMTVALLEAVQLPFQCMDTINYWFQAKMRSKSAVIVQVLAHFITSAFKIFLLATGQTVEWFGFALSLEVILTAIGYFSIYISSKGQPLKLSGSTAKRLLQACGPFIIANLMTVIYGQMDRIMIKQMLDSTAQVGLYSAAVTICQLFGFLPITILDAARPAVVEANNQGKEQFSLRFRQLAAAVLWSCILFSIGVTIFAKLILYILYGEEFLEAGSCLQTVVWYTSFSYLGSAMHLWLVCQNQNNKVMVFCALGSVFNLIANFLLIPILGINGAAIATLITQMLTNFVCPLLIPSTRPYALAVIDAFLLRNIALKDLVGTVLPKKGK